MSNINDFVIENGVLIKYQGPGGDVVIPDGVTRIDDMAFTGCTSLTSVVISEGVTSIGDSAFSGCKGLADANGFVIVQNALHGYYGKGGDVVIPEGVTSIGWGAFAGCSSLTSVVIPEGVTSIGEGAFAGCSSLASVVIPESVTSIGDEAFSYCKSLTGVVIPEGVKIIGKKAFAECDELCTIIAPSMPLQYFIDEKLDVQAACGFLSAREFYTDPDECEKYKKICMSKRKKLLAFIFKLDDAKALSFYIDEKKVTAKNFDTDYFVPALQVGAEKCKALLLEWKEQH